MPARMNLIKSSVITVMLLNVVLSSFYALANNSLVNDTVTTANTRAAVEGGHSVSREKGSTDHQSKTELMAILSNINYFSAKFTQKIFDESGEELQQGSGQLSVSKPNLVNWETKSPSESLIISDGESLWFYDPFVEQVSVYSLENAIANTPILLITNNDAKLWQDYKVSKLTDSRYLIEGINENARVKSLELTFDSSETNIKLAGFSILDATGQLSVIYLSEQSLQDSSANNDTQSELFKFTVPEGVYLDDQR